MFFVALYVVIVIIMVYKEGAVLVASRLKRVRDTLGLSMVAFGKKLGCSRDVVANIEYGRSEPKEVFLNHVCDIFGVNRQWLFFGMEPMFDEKAGDDKVREAAELFRALSSDLRELALSQMKSLQKLMIKNEANRPNGTKENLDTVRLMAAMLEAQEFGELEDKSVYKVRVGEQIQAILGAKKLTLEQIADDSGVDEKELRKLVNTKSVIRRDVLIAVSIALTLDVEEAQRLLTAAGLPALYAKNRRDAACIFALMKGLCVEELNEILAGLDESSL